MTDKEQLAESANALLHDPQAPEMYHTLLEVLGLPLKLPVKLTGDAAVLNPLLALARRDRETFTRVIDLIESKRARQELPPLRCPLEKAKFDKNKYQRELMAERRSRAVKAVDIENLRRPPSSQLIGHPRMEFMRVQLGKWSARFDERVAAVKVGKTMPKAQRQTLAAEFLDSLDRELEIAEAAVYRWIQSGRKGECP